jgi:antitoxin CptB
MTEIPNRLRWACRRGMLELDILLGHFLTEAYTDLTSIDKDSFVKLLSESDQDLFMWLSGKVHCPDPLLASMIEKIRYHAKHRH